MPQESTGVSFRQWLWGVDGVLAPASRLGARIAPVRWRSEATADAGPTAADEQPKRGARRTWPELLAGTLRIDVLGAEPRAARAKPHPV